MRVVAPVEEASRTRRHMLVHGKDFWHTNYMGMIGRERPADVPEPGPDELYPMAFMIDQWPDIEGAAHFHRANQFQVIVGGGGRIGAHEVESLSIHYTNAFTAYGPLVSGPSGLAYLTLRNRWDPGARYMPGARLELRAATPRVHREEVAGPVPTLPPDELRSLAEASETALLPLGPDGLGAWLHRLPAGAGARGADPAEGGGQFWIVIGGTAIRADGAPLEPLSCIFLSPDEEPATILAGTDGLEILAVQFPNPPAPAPAGRA